MYKKETTLNKYGYYELTVKPSQPELDEYYMAKYYQDGHGDYSFNYSDEELKYFNFRIELKHIILNRLGIDRGSLLDVGCGEGFALKYFKNINWNVKGIEYTSLSCKVLNPDCVQFIEEGDVFKNLTKQLNETKKYDVVWLDNVLEHVLNPLQLLKDCKQLLTNRGVLIIEVPNDFSALQTLVKAENNIEENFWVAAPDHISYFNSNGLNMLAAEAGLTNEITISDFPIDFYLTNPSANYVIDKSKGKGANLSRIKLSNLMHSISPEESINFYQSLAKMGLGRQIISFFKKASNV